jgi:hypothetical protein
MSCSCRRSTAIVALAISAVATPASADTLQVLSDFFFIQAGTGTTLFEQNHLYLVPRFDASLGTLDGIVLTAVRGGIPATVTIDSESLFQALVLDNINAVAFTSVSYSGGQLAGISHSVEGPFPGFPLGADSDGTSDFVGSDAYAFSGVIPAITIDETISDAASLADFTGLGFVLLTLTIRELAGSDVPGIQDIQASYGAGIGVIGLAYDYTAAPARVPEPGILALLGVSCAMGASCAIAQRRRRLPR